MKKAAAWISAAVLAVFLLACGGGDRTGNAGASSDGGGSLRYQEQTAPILNVLGDLGADDGAESTGTGPHGWSPEMEEIRSAVADTLGEGYRLDEPISQEVLEQSYGIVPDMYEDYLGETPSLSLDADTFLVVKAKEGQVEAVEEALSSYREGIVKNRMQYSLNVGKVCASRIETLGNYVCFVQLGGDVDRVKENGDEAVAAHCLEQNEIAITVLEQTIGH